LTEAVRLVDAAVTADVRWQPVQEAPSVEEFAGWRRWRCSRPQDGLTLVALGGWPLLFTIGRETDLGAMRVHRRLPGGALARVAKALEKAGGHLVANSALPARMAQAAQHEWWRTETVHAIETQQVLLAHRQCPACDAWQAADATLCCRCRRAFTPAEDHARDVAAARTRQLIDRLWAELHRRDAAQTQPTPGGAMWPTRH
jgi:hypothetical protein